MGILKRLFGGADGAGAGASPTERTAAGAMQTPVGVGAPRSTQLPSGMVAPEFGEVNVRDLPKSRKVDFTILMEPTGVDSEGWQTGVALDCSTSMLTSYGHALVPANGAPKLTPEFRAQLQAKGHIEVRTIDGVARPMLTESGSQELRRLGYTNSPNDVEPVARQFTAYLAERLDADGGTTVIYWACGSGREFEVVGDFTAEQCRSAAFRGPSHAGFGKATFLAPAVRYFVDRFEDAKNGMYVFITDGRIDDLDDVKRLSMELCQQIAAGRRNRLKFVLIGVGRQVDEGQMTELDDLDSGTDVDLWDHKIAREMRQLAEIFAEVVDERQIVAPVGKLVDSSGNVIRAMSDGVPARLEFEIGSEHGWFELVVGEHRIRQALPPHSGGGG
jgi:hypothetical protein